MNKTLKLVLLALFVIWLIWLVRGCQDSSATFLGIKQASEYISIPLIEPLDSSGLPCIPESVHIITYADNGSAAAFTTTNTTYPFSAVGIDTIKIYGDTNYFFVDQIQDIDGTGANFELAIMVILFTDGLPTQTHATVQVITDSLENFLDASMDSSSSAAVLSKNCLDTAQAQDGWIAHQSTADSIMDSVTAYIDSAYAFLDSFFAVTFLTTSDNIGINWADIDNPSANVALLDTDIDNVLGYTAAVNAFSPNAKAEIETEAEDALADYGASTHSAGDVATLWGDTLNQVAVAKDSILAYIDSAYAYLDSFFATTFYLWSTGQRDSLLAYIDSAYAHLDSFFATTFYNWSTVQRDSVLAYIDSAYALLDSFFAASFQADVDSINAYIDSAYAFLDSFFATIFQADVDSVNAYIDSAYALLDSFFATTFQADVDSINAYIDSAYALLDSFFATTFGGASNWSNAQRDSVLAYIDSAYAFLDSFFATVFQADMDSVNAYIDSAYAMIDSFFATTFGGASNWSNAQRDSVLAYIDSAYAFLDSFFATNFGAGCTGWGLYAVTIQTLDVSDSTTGIPNVKIVIYDSTSGGWRAGAISNASGERTFSLDAATYTIHLQDPPNSITSPVYATISSDTTLTYYVTTFDPGSPPVGEKCRMWTLISDLTSDWMNGCRLSIWVPSRFHPVTLDTTLVSPYSVSGISNDTGFVYVDVYKQKELTAGDGTVTVTVHIEARSPSGDLLGRKLLYTVPDSTSHKIVW